VTFRVHNYQSSQGNEVDCLLSIIYITKVASIGTLGGDSAVQAALRKLDSEEDLADRLTLTTVQIVHLAIYLLQV